MSTLDELAQANALLEAGAITREEFERVKTRLLADHSDETAVLDSVGMSSGAAESNSSVDATTPEHSSSSSGTRLDTKRTALILASVVVGLLLLAGGAFAYSRTIGRTSTSATTSNGGEATATLTVTVPDLVALGGESPYSKDDGLNKVSDQPRHYGVAGLADKYRELATTAGLKVELHSSSEYDDAFGGGRAGWPKGQDPAPGTSVPRGSVVKLILIDDSMVSETVKTAPKVTSEAEKDGEFYLYIKGISEEDGVLYMSADYVQMLFGAAATERAGYETEYYVVNDNPKLRRIPMKAGGGFRYLATSQKDAHDFTIKQMADFYHQSHDSGSDQLADTIVGSIQNDSQPFVATVQGGWIVNVKNFWTP